jgi:tRNA dimethylallyltransferase
MDIGTAKPAPEEMELVPHHLFNIIYPDCNFSLAQYQELAYKSIEDIHERQHIPIIVGGSGQYIWAVLEGWEIPRIPPNTKLRIYLEKKAQENGIEDLFQHLQKLDPAAAQKIDKRNIRRVIRALEVSITTNAPISTLQKKNPPGFAALIIGLTADRKTLYGLTDSRVENMILRGLSDETQKLNEMGYGFNLPALNCIGYKQIGVMLKGDINQEEAIKKIKVATHKFVRHQYAWFRLEDRRIAWFDITSDINYETMLLVDNFLANIGTIQGVGRIKQDNIS